MLIAGDSTEIRDFNELKKETAKKITLAPRRSDKEFSVEEQGETVAGHATKRHGVAEVVAPVVQHIHRAGNTNTYMCIGGLPNKIILIHVILPVVAFYVVTIYLYKDWVWNIFLSLKTPFTSWFP